MLNSMVEDGTRKNLINVARHNVLDGGLRAFWSPAV